MGRITRRAFIGTGALAGLASAGVAAGARRPAGPAVADSRIDLVSDGVGLLPGEYARLLATLSSREGLEDEYGRGGAVTALEQQFAQLLDKEMAVFMPSGTLANHLAIRALAGTRRRAVVQQVSHVYNDTGDCAQQLSGLTLLPLAPGRATFSWDEVRAEIDRAAGGRVATSVGAISIETPIRRLHNATFDFAEMTRISEQARAAGIGLHLDGARLFVEAAFTGRALKEYTQLFDTVYVSLWKCFNAGNGAILAGPRSMLEGMYHVRRMFGGALHHAWPDAVVAAHYAEGYLQRMRAAIDVAEDTWKALSADPRFTIERVPNGTSSLKLTVKNVKSGDFRERLSRAGIVLPEASDGAFWLRVNETLARTSPRELAGRFVAAVEG